METHRHREEGHVMWGREIKVVPLYTRKVRCCCQREAKRKARNRFSFGAPRRNPPSQYLAS